MSDWRPIDTLPDDIKSCWIAHAPSGVMVVGVRHAIKGVWRLQWADRTLAWLPTHWQPLPEPPSQKSNH